MHIEEITLNDFRNYHNLTLSFKKGLNIFVGKNGVGKSNLLESIYYAVFSTSFRTSKTDVLCKDNKGNFSITLKLKEQEDYHTIQISVLNGKKKILWNNKTITRIKHIQEVLKVIFFSSKDIDLILLSPSLRRNYFDQTISLMKSEYQSSLENYQKVLQHRNHELQKFKKSNLWDEKIIYYGQQITQMRNSFLKAISLPLNKIFYSLVKSDDFKPSIFYSQNGTIQKNFTPINHSEYQKILEANYSKDQYKGYTHFGPHNDDYIFYLKNHVSKLHSSQGENRLFVFALKFAIHEYFKKVLGKSPLLILDDIFSDFDPDRLNFFFNYLEKQNQSIIACANENLFKPFVKQAEIYHVKKGSIHPWIPTT